MSPRDQVNKPLQRGQGCRLAEHPGSKGTGNLIPWNKSELD